VETVEYIIPADRHADATVRQYDTSAGQAKQDWRLMHSATCTAKDGYTAALSAFANGASMDEIQKRFALADKSQARALVHDAMLALQRRYWKDN
jgi:hypothetical protein